MTREERHADIDKKINSALSVGLENRQSDEQISYVDQVVRPAMKWIDDMQQEQHDVVAVTLALVSGTASLFCELALRLNSRDDIDGGVKLVQTMINDLATFTVENMEINFNTANAGRKAH